ncbi:MAG TPA: aminotransferase class V-fold PLP-dependent enzyme [Thermoanaerobaculia bacterium]|nr:aminotransferase class V-fold PLP-dependent enzyme [Thermoanaerobaculia bacterium]
MISKILLRREQFPVTESLVYFNHAAVGPLSHTACSAMERHAREQRDLGALNWRDWFGEIAEFREEAAALIHADASEISILKNTSEGLSFVANGFRWESGDNVVITDAEFPSNSVPWKRLGTRGVECREIPARSGGFTVADAERLIDARTRILSVSAVAFHDGFSADLVALGELCASRGVLFCVDAIQALGAVEVDVRKAKIHFLAADGHKWLLGPEGTAIFYAAADVRERLEVLETGWMNADRGARMIDCPTDLLPDGRRFEAGSINTNGVYGLRASIALLRHIGLENIEREVLWIAGALAAMLGELGLEVRSPMPIASGIVAAAAPPDVDMAKLRSLAGLADDHPADAVGLIHRWLEDCGIVCSAREGMLRFAPHFYNDEEDLERLREALEEALGR